MAARSGLADSISAISGFFSTLRVSVPHRARPEQLPRRYKILRLHPQRVGHARDVIEVGDDLGRVVEGAVVQAVRPQRVEVGGGQVVLDGA